MTLLFINSKLDIENIKKSVVLIQSYDANGEIIATGSGFIAFAKNILVTNAHVIEDSYRIEVISEDNYKYNIQGIIGYSKSNDIAIIKLEDYKDLHPLKISINYTIGDPVYAIGSPLGIKNTISNGVISGNLLVEDIESIQHTAPISSGSSGGVLLSNSGKVLGITYASFVEGQNLNLAIPIETVEKLYKKVKDYKAVDLAYKNFLSNKILKYETGWKILEAFLSYDFPFVNLKKTDELNYIENVNQVAHFYGDSDDAEYVHYTLEEINEINRKNGLECSFEFGKPLPQTQGCVIGGTKQLNENFKRLNIGVVDKGNLTDQDVKVLLDNLDWGENKKYISDKDFYYLIGYENVNIDAIINIFK